MCHVILRHHFANYISAHYQFLTRGYIELTYHTKSAQVTTLATSL